MAKEFYNDLINYVASSDTDNANTLLMKELGKSLVKSKENFVELLTSSGVAANDSMSDVELIDAFVDNLANNKTLMISAAYMINKQNSFSNADGEEQISDNGVKLSYKVMYDYFNGEKHSNVVAAIAAGVGALAGLGTAGIQASQRNKYATTDALSRQQDAKNQLVQSVLASKQQQAIAKQSQSENKAKAKKILLITAGSLLVLGLIGFIIYKIKKR
jgi:hypothetical protein